MRRFVSMITLTFGNATSPRIGGVMTIPQFDAVTLRLSWGEGFRAPDLSDMYGLTSFSASAGNGLLRL